MILYIVTKHGEQQKTNPPALMGYEIDNELMSDMRKKKATIASSVQFRMAYYNLRNEFITKMSSIDYKVLKEP